MPYAWLDGETSTIDCCTEGFALLLGPESRRRAEVGAWPTTAVLSHETLHRFGIEPTGAMLVRPDGFVAWRARDDGPAVAEEASRVLRMVTAA